MTGSELQQLIINSLVKTRGGTRQRWRRVVGEVRVYPVETHPHCNWDVRPYGAPADIDAVEEVADALRIRHTRVSAD